MGSERSGGCANRQEEGYSSKGVAESWTAALAILNAGVYLWVA
jgi:hypothetical protein